MLVSCLQEEDIKSVVATLAEGGTVDYSVKLEFEHGESKFFITLYYKHILNQETESCNICFMYTSFSS